MIYLNLNYNNRINNKKMKKLFLKDKQNYLLYLKIRIKFKKIFKIILIYKKIKNWYVNFF